MSFSERYGLKPKKAIQVDSMDDALRNSLWNVLVIFYFDLHTSSQRRSMYPQEYLQSVLIKMYYDVITLFLKQRIDVYNDLAQKSINKEEVSKAIIEHYYFKTEWFRVYDLIEFIISTDETVDLIDDNIKNTLNFVLRDNLSGYRYMNRKFVPITSEYEINAVEEALEKTGAFISVNKHLKKSLAHLSNKTNPDYHNSIKEAICAVEAICKRIASNDRKLKNNATLGQALNTIEKMKNISINGRLKEAFNQLYAYTNDGNGVRHALTNKESTLDIEDAKYMLVSCSAFINYLIVKADKAGINLID